jgi:hypothetical protein
VGLNGLEVVGGDRLESIARAGLRLRKRRENYGGEDKCFRHGLGTSLIDSQRGCGVDANRPAGRNLAAEESNSN